ncbi:MAG: hypothetical protein NZ581_08890, partial [Candidatus Caldarchaeum sp.]|nr:hypothetical protein [Candidatus Caldarchaeum sp.]MDW8436288.1 hypothetical protein [Candidatus Caldarchaeum sp.]
EQEKLSMSFVRDMKEWMERIIVAAGSGFVRKLISHVIGRNASKSLNNQESDRLADFLVSCLERRWRPVHRSAVPCQGRTLSEEFMDALQAEMGARRGVEV